MAFERTQTNLDTLLYKRTFEKDTSKDTRLSDTKLIEVHMTIADGNLEVRTQQDWTGAGKNRHLENIGLLYWAVRTERQGLLLSVILSNIVSQLGDKGYTHVEHTLHDQKYNIPITSFKHQVYNIIPRTTIQAHKGPTGGWGVPDYRGILHHFVVGTADDGTKVAVDIGYAQFHPSPLSPPDTPPSLLPNGQSPTIIPFMISEEKELLDHIAVRHKLVRDLAETEAAKKNPLFKHKLANFFTAFSVDPMKIKEIGNAEFERKNYEGALSWYSFGISFEINKKSKVAHILYSNRSTTYYQMGQHLLALEDADRAISLAPKWPKGYIRKVAALEALERFQEADDVSDKMQALTQAVPSTIPTPTTAKETKEEEGNAEKESRPKNKKIKL